MGQEDLSRRTGLHRSEIGPLERGLGVPRVDTAIEILESANADPRSLLEGIGRHGPMRLDEKGRFTIAGIDGPVDLRPPRPERESR
jgi:transcriptional regulator with XRE-family HTH domain